MEESEFKKSIKITINKNGKSRNIRLFLDLRQFSAFSHVWIKCPSFRSDLVSRTLWHFIEMEDALHWLSTLGGAYSNLGEGSEQFAVKAGKNAYNQMKIALRSGDLTVQMKCWLFVGMALMQLKRFSESARVIKSVYDANKSRGALLEDPKVKNMCLGIWARLQHAHKVHRMKMKENECS